MANTIFEASYYASRRITAIFDIVWALDAGLWNLRQDAKQFFQKNPNASNNEAQSALVQGLTIHGLNLMRIANELPWEYEEQFIAELLLINALAIFDAWADSFVDSTLISLSNTSKKKIKDDLKKGAFSCYESALSAENTSALSGCFHFTAQKQVAYINNLWLIYRYFKSCRNCCAHGNSKFNSVAERNYEAIKNLTKEDCGLNEFPMIASTQDGTPVKLHLRGVVGFYDVLIKIINHYDLTAAEKTCVEFELLKRWGSITSKKLPSSEEKRNRYIRNCLKSVNMCPSYCSKTTDVYNFLLAKNAILR